MVSYRLLVARPARLVLAWTERALGDASSPSRQANFLGCARAHSFGSRENVARRIQTPERASQGRRAGESRQDYGQTMARLSRPVELPCRRGGCKSVLEVKGRKRDHHSGAPGLSVVARSAPLYDLLMLPFSVHYGKVSALLRQASESAAVSIAQLGSPSSNPIAIANRWTNNNNTKPSTSAPSQ